ncbi:MAG TPA: septum formation initiator family protein [Bryobacteraceae bacterium]|jgi:cell division protein FtsB
MKPSLVRFAYLLVFLMAASYALFALRGPHGVRAFREKQRQIQEMEQRNQDLDREIERKKEHIQRLTSNPDQQELEIRERLKLVHPGEKVFVLGEPEKK